LEPGACELQQGACESKRGACESKPGACELKRGACELKRGTCELKPGACELERGACESKPGACELKRGACELEPGACESKRGACESKPGACELKPETCESRPALCNFRAGYARGVLDSWRETGGYGRKPFVAARSPQGRSATHGDVPTPKPCAALPDVGSSPCLATTPCLAANPQPADRGGLPWRVAKARRRTLTGARSGYPAAFAEVGGVPPAGFLARRGDGGGTGDTGLVVRLHVGVGRADRRDVVREVGEFARKGIGGGEQRFLVHAGRAAEAVREARFAGIDGARRAGDFLQIEAQRIEKNLLHRRRAAILPRLLDVEIADGLRH